MARGWLLARLSWRNIVVAILLMALRLRGSLGQPQAFHSEIPISRGRETNTLSSSLCMVFRVAGTRVSLVSPIL